MVASPRSPAKNRPASRPIPAASFPLVIKGWREEREWSQRAMANFLGVSQSCVARWETASRTPSVDELTRLGVLLRITWKLG